MADLDAEYIRTMEEVLAVYERPFDLREPVICLDERPVALRADVRPGRPARPGQIAKRDSEYERRGTVNIFAIVEPKAGRHLTCAAPNRSGAQFARVIQRVVAAYPNARTIHLVVDNLNIHGEKSLTAHFGRRTGRRLWRRLTVHFTPKHGSWLHQAESELSLVSRGCLGRRRIPGVVPLQRAIRAWFTRANRAPTQIHWQFTRKDARRKFGYQKNLSSRPKT